MKCTPFFTVLWMLPSFTTASVAGYWSLKTCATNALIGPDAAGRVITPQDDRYTDARLGEKVQFQQFPTLIAYATKAEEVAPLIRCAQKAGIKVVPRSGGHHFEAYSSLNGTLVIDLAHINHVEVSSDRLTATVGAGIRLGALYTALDAYNTSFVGGICPTVGLAGLLSAGGFNSVMRQAGLSVDHVKSAKVVTADGTTLVASSSSHPDLFWAIRGGGGSTWGVVVEFTLYLSSLPRSAMVSIAWEDPNSSFDVAKRFLEWAPRQPKEFTSQVNVFRDYVQILGWYLGGTRQELHGLIEESGLLHIGNPQLNISGNCNTDNSRIYGYTTYDCVADDKVDASILNVVPEPYAQYKNSTQFKYDEIPAATSRATASPWPRYLRMAKSFFVQKSKLLSDDALREVVNRIGQLDENSQIWGEWHAWNISGDSTADSAFAWRDQAYAHLEFQIHGSEDPRVQAEYERWMSDLEAYLRPIVGPASYTGYMDKDISSNPLNSYFGDNVCRLIGIKKAYDPTNFFTYPNAIPPTPPGDIHC